MTRSPYRMVSAASVRRPASSRSRKQPMRPYPSSNPAAFSTLATEFSTRQSALPVTPSVTAERKSMKPSNTRHSSAGMSFAFTSDTDFGGMQPFEISASDFIATCHVRKANGKIPFSTHTVVQAAAVTGCDGVRDAPFL